MDFAIVAVDCILPGSPDADHWMQATASAIRPVPGNRWPRRSLENATPGTPDRTVSRLGAWLDDRDGLIPWTERVLQRVLDASRVSPKKTHLVLANLSLPSTAAVRGLDLTGVDPIPALLQGEPQPRHSSAPAEHAARFFGLASAVSLDAACASGLYAVRLACDALASGRCDAAIAAGVQACDPSYLLVGFSQLLALSPTGTPRPLDREANGLVVGEGAAAVVLKRLPDAIAAGDPIHAVLRGGGLGNDGRKGNMLSPDTRGQLRAMRAAWASTGLDPRELGYIECHATGTKLGDATEVRSLRALLEEAGPVDTPVAVGSAKALIGHTITVAGLAGLLRAVGAVREGRIPKGPEAPLEILEESTHLRSSPGEAWPKGVPRRAAVSAFGFGGTNAHLIVDAPPARPAAKRPAAPPPQPEREGRFGIRAGLRRILQRDRPTAENPAPPPEPLQLPAVEPARLVQTPRLAVVGVAAQIGSYRNEALFAALAAGRNLADARGRTPIDAVHVDPRRWRIPPLELADVLPQQLLAMEVGADALEVAGLDARNTGCIFGMGLDPQVCEQVVRWAADAVERVPPLDAQRVQGQLPNFVANRLSAQLDLEGPSYTVSAGGASGLVALDHAARLLANDAVDAVVVGAVDLAGPVQGGIALVVRRLDDTPVEARLAAIDLEPKGTAATRGEHSGVLTGLLDWLTAWARREDGPVTAEAPAGTVSVGLSGSRPPQRQPAERSRPLVVPNGRYTPEIADFYGSDRPAHVLSGPVQDHPTPGWSAWLRPVDADAPVPQAPRAAREAPTPARRAPASTHPAPPPMHMAPSAAVGMEAPVEAPALDPGLLGELDAMGALAGTLARANDALADAHSLFLESQAEAARQLVRLGEALRSVDPDALPAGLESWTEAVDRGPWTVDREAPPAGRTSSRPAPRVLTGPPPRSYDREALLLHASGRLSEVFGPTFADQDAYEPRTRMPEPPLLLCSRVLTVEGEPGKLEASRIVTEYDLPTDASWSHHDGKPNACVIVESGQADLFLVSFLGIEAHCKGERVYRLLDCDLTFHGPRPEVGETLHHDIRIKRFARLGGTILFYFEYDCTSNTDGRPVLSMRNGCAGFFTPEELATPHGVDPKPLPLEKRPAPTAPLRHTSVTALGARGVQAIVEGRYSDAFGPGFADADGSRLTLPDSEWRLVHRIEEVRTSGGPYGLGIARFEQVLRDDDWFNPCHFKGDPCMPGTLMLEGCLQAVQTWLVAAGVPATHREHLFEPLPELPFELRCRGQVVPGHSSLVYEARIREARLDGTPYAIADVLLSVDGTPVVLAKNIGVTVGLRGATAGIDAAGPTGEAPRSTVHGPRSTATPVVDTRRIYEYSIGDAERAFGPRYAEYAGISPRCARMPGPPLLQMTRVIEAEHPFEVRQGESVAIEYDVPPNAWYFEPTPGTSMPFAILLETALQPCGWLTAWQAAGIKDGRDLFFRNLGGKATQHVEIWPDAGTLTTRTKQTVVAESAGLLIHNFALTVHAGDTLVYDCTTSFGYFTANALDGQKGLPLKDEERRRAARAKASGRTIDLRDHPSMPRGDWRNLDEVVVIDETGGKAGLGFYEAVKHIDPTEWFFTAHFFLDPVMPGSLGLEASLQLARFVLEDRTGRKARTTPIRLNVPHEWKYRGQIRRPVKQMTLELEVTSITDDEIVFDAVLRGDGLPIYEMIGFGITAVEPREAPAPPALPARGPHVGALLDDFTVHGNAGTGRLRLDPARFPWLADHCPTVTAPALPMAFAAEIAAEAALQIRPGALVTGVPVLEAEKWIHTGDGPIDLLVVAVAEGDHVAVSLAVHVDNPRFPKLSGPKVHMKAVVQLGDAYPTAPAIPGTLDGAAPVGLSIDAYYGGGLTFHGPSLQGMTDLGVRSATGAIATFHTKPDAVLNGPGAPFVLDPLLLDTATHPMVSGEPEIWSPEIGPGHLAYPVKAEGMRFYGPRPEGAVTCRLDLVHADARTLVFDVALVGAAGTWCTFRWTEALVPGGPVLGHDTPTRKAFVWDGVPVPEVAIGARNGEVFRVSAADLVEPIEGTLVGLFCTEAERRDYAASADRRAWELKRFAAKGAVRAWLQDRVRDVHPRDLDLLDLRDDRFIATNCPALTAQELVDALGPTRFHIEVRSGADWAEAWLVPTGWPT
ncbi:MAG: polyketide synthase dehydratase domain-containing protein [Alphaproteobacteria bacterium]|nr:polyketide synthase dehydratase domain-containing protein [Alphaproteobacteria bacterium]